VHPSTIHRLSRARAGELRGQALRDALDTPPAGPPQTPKAILISGRQHSRGMRHGTAAFAAPETVGHVPGARTYVTGAALVMVCVFALFGTLASLDLKQAGVGLAAAVLIDATVIRSVLLPATMALLGERNWYLPRRRRGAQNAGRL